MAFSPQNPMQSDEEAENQCLLLSTTKPWYFGSV
jgi:hypothetical protein